MNRAALLVALAACQGSAAIDAADAPADDVETDAGTDVPDTDSDPPAPTETDPAEDTDTVDSEDTEAPIGDACTFEDGAIPNLGITGTAGVATRTGSKRFGDCEMAYTVYAPNTGTPAAVGVVLAHGFQRGPAQVTGWARHFASWGFEVVVPGLCHSSILDVDHEQNGVEIAALADEVFAGRKVIYGGHSAGGLASLVAAAADRDAAGVLGLDLVDASDVGKRKASQVTVPVWGLRGESGSCNSNANSRFVYAAAADGRSYRVTEATHCDFEDTTDILCTGVCWGPLNPRFDDAVQRRVIRALGTGFLMSVSGVDPDGEQFWTVGCEPFENFRRSGLLK